MLPASHVHLRAVQCVQHITISKHAVCSTNSVASGTQPHTTNSKAHGKTQSAQYASLRTARNADRQFCRMCGSTTMHEPSVCAAQNHLQASSLFCQLSIHCCHCCTFHTTSHDKQYQKGQHQKGLLSPRAAPWALGRSCHACTALPPQNKCPQGQTNCWASAQPISVSQCVRHRIISRRAVCSAS